MATVKKAMTPEAIAASVAATDWAKVDATTDADIARQIASDPDTAPEATDVQLYAARLRTLRQERGLSQSAFAARYSIPLRTLQGWEQGRTLPDAPSRAYLRVIAHAPGAVEAALGEPAAAL
jgi:putative transcriptional regulator